MSEYHDRIRNSIEAGEESDYQQDCLNLLTEIAALRERIKELEAELAECFEGAIDLIHERMLAEEANRKLRDAYNELIIAVGNKYLDESQPSQQPTQQPPRHQTALRYIMEAEKGGGIAKTALEVKP